MNNNILQMMSQIKSNPIQFIIQRGFNLPQNVGTNPDEIIQHLMNTGQISQEKYNQVYSFVQQFKR